MLATPDDATDLVPFGPSGMDFPPEYVWSLAERGVIYSERVNGKLFVSVTDLWTEVYGYQPAPDDWRDYEPPGPDGCHDSEPPY
jgi:hypothetical protein